MPCDHSLLYWVVFEGWTRPGPCFHVNISENVTALNANTLISGDLYIRTTIKLPLFAFATAIRFADHPLLSYDPEQRHHVKQYIFQRGVWLYKLHLSKRGYFGVDSFDSPRSSKKQATVKYA